jgi:ApaG protein
MIRVEAESAPSRNRVEVSVEVIHSPSHSRPGQLFYIYFITVRNLGSNRVQLLRRHWDIRSGDGQAHTVDDVGVIGQQPVLEPGEEFVYNSGVPISRAPGVMGGYYTFQALDTEVGDADGLEPQGAPEFFRVPIANFELYVPEEELPEERHPNPSPRVLN